MARPRNSRRDHGGRNNPAVAEAKKSGTGEDYENDEREPLSLAEELVSEAASLKDEIHERYEQIKQAGDTHIAEGFSYSDSDDTDNRNFPRDTFEY